MTTGNLPTSVAAVNFPLETRDTDWSSVPPER